MFWRHDNAKTNLGDYVMAMRDGDWKILSNKDNTDFELYNLEIDPYETTDRQLDEPLLFEELKAKIIQLNKESDRENQGRCYEQWAVDTFEFVDLINPDASGIWAPDADPNGNGLPNLFDYLYGNDPLATTEPGYRHEFFPDGDFTKLRWRLRLTADDTLLKLGNSVDLADWPVTEISDLNYVVTNPDPDGTGRFQDIEVRDLPAPGHDRNFYRLQVEQDLDFRKHPE